MRPTHAININDRTFDVVMFLNDGVPPRPDQDNHFLVCEIRGAREITAKIMSEDEFYGMKGIEDVNVIM